MTLTIKFYDVEHGSCTHIITPNNKHILVDIGTKDSKSICKHLKEKHLNGDKIDYLVLTHPHLDHIQDLLSLHTYDVKPRVLNRPNLAFPLVATSAMNEHEKKIISTANSMNDEYNHAILSGQEPWNPVYNGGVSFSFFKPLDSQCDKNDLNSFSNVIVLEYSGFKIVLTGDNPKEILKDMVEVDDFQKAIKDATILLAPHHGRDSDFCETFVDFVNPRLTVISDSHIKYSTQEYSAQKYGNKTRGTTWSGQNRKVFTTRNDGTISFSFNSDNSWSITASKDE